MEPRLPFDHHRDNHRHHHHHHHQDLNTRYASLPLPPPPPPRFPDDRDFYHHQHHPPQRLQPPPPPPRPRLPPPPPHPSFQYQSFPVEDRRPTFDFHPPPPSNRIPFERSHNHHHHHQQQQPRFLEDHPPDVWPPPPPPPPPPRVSVDNHWDHHNHHSLMSPYKRFADEDEKSFLFRKGNQKEEFLWGERDYHSNRRDAPPPPPRSFDSSSSRFTFGKGTIAEVENVRWGSSAKPSQRESEEQLGENIRWGSSAKPSQRESEEQLGESMRWGSAKPPQREMSSFAYKQHSTVEIGEKEIESEHWLNEDGNRNLSGKRFHNQLKVGKSKKGGSQEFVIYNPKKKVQRTSALLRVGKTPNKCTEEDEETYPSNFPEDSNSGSPSQRRHLVFSEEITDQSKSEGSVDLDVSFKSNALVAKAIMPPGHVIGSDTTSTPNHLKRRKVGSPVFSVSSPRVTEIHEMSPNRDGSKKHLSAVSSSKKSLTPSKDKAATSLIGSSTGINSLPSLDGFSVPTDRSVTKTIPWSAEVGSENKPLNGDRPTENVNVTSSSSKIAVQSKNKGSSSGIGTVGGITSLSRLNGSVVPLEKSRDNVLSLGATKSDKRPLNEDNLTLKLGSGPTCNRALTQSSNEVVISGIGARIDTQPSPNGISIPHEKTLIENRWNSASPADSAKIMQSKSNFSTSSDGAGTADDIGSLLSLSVTGKTPSSISSCQNPLNEYVHTPDTAVTFGKGLCPTNAKHKVSCAKSGVEDVDPEVCRNGTTAVLNAVAKEKTMLNSIAGFDNELNGQSSASKLVESSNFNKGLCLTQPKDKVVIAGLRNGDWEPCPSGVSVPVEMTMTGKTGVSAAVELHGKSSNTEHSIPKVDATSSSNEGLAQSKGDIASHPCLNRTDVPLEATIMRNNPRSTIVGSDKNMVKIEGSRLSEAKGTESGSGIQGATCSPPCLNWLAEMNMTGKNFLDLTGDSDVACTPKAKKRNRKKKKKVQAPDSSLPSPATETVLPADLPALASNTSMPVIGVQTPATKVNYDVVSGDSSCKGADVTTSFVKSLETLEEGEFAGSEISNDVCLQTSDNLVNTSLERGNVMALLPSSSGLSKTELVKADVSIVCDKANFRAVNSLVQSEEVAVSGTGLMGNDGLQSLHGMALSLEKNAAVISLSSPLPVSAGANKRKRKRKKKKGTDHSLGLSSTTVDTHEKHATQNSDQGLPADTGLRQSEDQASVSAIKMKDNVDLQLLQRVTVSPEKSGAPKFLQSPVEDCAEVPKVKRKNVFERLSGFPSSGATQSNRGPRDSDRPNYCADISLNSEKGKTKSEEINAVSRNGISNDDLRSIHGNGEIEVHPNSVVASPDTSKVKKKIKTVKKIKKIKTVKKIKKKLTLLDSVSLPRSSVKCGVHDELVNATTCNDCITAASISDKGQKKSDTETLDDVSSHSLHERPLSTENSLEERSPINMVSVRHGINVYDDRITAQPNNSSSFLEASTFPDGHPASAQSNIISSSLVEDSTILNVYSSVENSLQIVMPSDVIESESGGREGAVHVDTAGKTRVLGRDIVKDIAMPSVGQEKLNNLCGQLQDPVFNEKSQSEAMEEELDALPVRAESSSLYTYVSPREEASGTSITNSNEEGVDSIAERPGSLDGQHLQILDSRRSQCRLSSRPLSDSERNVKSNQTTEAEYVTPKKTLALPSSLNQQSTYTLRPKVGTMIGKKTYQVPSVSKVLPARASLPSGYIKKTDSSTHSVGPRTWRRTADPLPQKVSCGTADHLQRPSVKKAQSTSYIRKGNSLVRKFAPVATTPQVSAGLSTSNSLLSNTSRGELRSTVSENKEVNCSGLKKFPTSGFERSKTPLLPHNIKLPIGSTKSSLATTSSPVPPLVLEGASEPTPGPAYRKADNNIGASNQNGLNKETGNRGVLDDGKSLPSNMKEITYVKRKSNQLVASCSTSHNVSSSSAENTQPLCLTTPSDQYYKKNKNQLIRTAPSSKGDLRQAAIPDDGSNSESQKASKVPSLRSNRSINKRKLDKGFLKTRKPSKFSLVWTLHDTQTQKEDTSPLQRLKVYPYLFPWKRTTQWRNCKFNLISSKGSFSRISKKLLLSRKRDAVYTRSTGGFSLRKSKVLSIGGSNLKWSKSIENRSKKANEEATLAVAAVERKKREQKGADCTIPAGKRKNQSSRERIFRIGSVRYKMDASKCTLQRIPDEESAGAVDHQSGNGTRKSFIPKRLLIDNDEYIRIGNGNKLVRDPKKLVRILASEKVRWSLHTARLRLAKKQQYCQFFTRFGKCNKGDGKCPYIHDPAKIAVCTKFLKGLCSNTSCKLTHKVIPERMEDCSYFLQGLCTNGSCPYRHVNVNPNASVCEGFLRGYCANGNECRKKHSYVCPIFKSTGICPQGSICKLHHPKSRSKTKKQRSKASKSTQGRYFGSKLNDTGGRGTVSADMHTEKNDDGIFTGHSDYISLDFGDEEGQDTDGAIGKYTMFYDSDSSDLQSDELDELIKPVRLMNK